MIGLDVKLERVLAQALTTSGGLEPGLADTLLRETHAALERQESQGNAPVLLVSPVLRARLCRASCGTTCRSWAFCRIRKYRMSAWSA